MWRKTVHIYHGGAAEFVDRFPELIAVENPSPEQVNKANETTLYWQCIPSRTLSVEDEELPTGFKQSKERVTVLACSNVAGTHRCKLLVIGKSKCLKALKGIKGIEVYPVIHRANKNVWITTELTID